MGLRETAQKAAQTGLKVAGNTKKTAVLKTGGAQSFNASTGQMEHSGQTTTNVEGILYSRKTKDDEGAVIKTDYFAYAAQDYPSIEVAEEDGITIDSIDRIISKIDRDPADALVILMLK
jgi:hypothetical protein